jgi:hypothetical protein
MIAFKVQIDGPTPGAGGLTGDSRELDEESLRAPFRGRKTSRVW